MRVCVSVCLSLRVCYCVSVCVCVCSSLRASVFLCACLCVWDACMPICLSVCLSACMLSHCECMQQIPEDLKADMDSIPQFVNEDRSVKIAKGSEVRLKVQGVASRGKDLVCVLGHSAGPVLVWVGTHHREVTRLVCGHSALAEYHGNHLGRLFGPHWVSSVRLLTPAGLRLSWHLRTLVSGVFVTCRVCLSFPCGPHY